MERITDLYKEDPGFLEQVSKKVTENQMDRQGHQCGSVKENKTDPSQR